MFTPIALPETPMSPRIAPRFFLGLCLMAGLLLSSLPGLAAQNATSGDAKAVTATVTAFYKKYNASYEDREKPFHLDKQAELDPEFLEKLKKLSREAEEENPDGGLGYDAIVMAQDLPQRMRYDAPVFKKDRAEIIARRDFGDGSFSPMCVVLKKRDTGWRITDVIDMVHFDENSVPECGGMKMRAPKG